MAILPIAKAVFRNFRLFKRESGEGEEVESTGFTSFLVVPLVPGFFSSDKFYFSNCVVG